MCTFVEKSCGVSDHLKHLCTGWSIGPLMSHQPICFQCSGGFMSGSLIYVSLVIWLIYDNFHFVVLI